MDRLINLLRRWGMRLSQPQTQQQIREFFLWGGVVLPFVAYFYYIFRYAVNVPFSDDYDTVFGFLVNFSKDSNWATRLGLLFSQHNEHRIVFSRLIYLVQYYVFGQVDFRFSMLMGNLGWVLTIIVLLRHLQKEYRASVMQVLPLPYILLTFIQFDDMVWGTTALVHYWAICFAVLFLLATSKGQWIYMSLLYGCALFTSGVGLVLFPIGIGFLGVERRWKAAVWFGLVAMVSTSIYLYGYRPVAQHPTIISTLMDFNGQLLVYFFTTVGSLSGVADLALLLGLAGFIGASRFSMNWPEKKTLLLVLLYTVLVSAGAALTRSGFGIGQAMDSKYAPFALLFWASLAMLIVLNPNEATHKPIVTFMVIGVATVYFSGVLIKFELTSAFARQHDERLSSLVAFSRGRNDALLFPNPTRAAQLLLEARELGIFDYHAVVTAIDQLPETVVINEVVPGQNFKGYMDYYTGTFIKGWAIIPNQYAANTTLFVLLTDGSKTFKLKTYREMRPDVSSNFVRPFFYDASGYFVFPMVYRLPSGNYKIGILIESKESRALMWTEEIYSVP